MSINLYMDENVHRGITTGLRLRDVDVLTVQEDDRSGDADPLVLDRATELKRVLFSQDDDLVAEAHRRQLEGVKFSGVIYSHQCNLSVGDCIRDLEIIAKASEPEELENWVQFLPL